MLRQLVQEYITDKTINLYTDCYSEWFEPYRLKAQAILEIGIGTVIPNVLSTMYGQEYNQLPNYKPGNSLRVWQKYFQQAQIYGIDVQPDTQFVDERIQTMLCDSTNPQAVLKTMHEHGIGDDYFDIIIDDGLHTQEAQLCTLTNLFKYVRPGGLYVIEDILVDCDLYKHPENYSFYWKNCEFTIQRTHISGLIIITKR